MYGPSAHFSAGRNRIKFSLYGPIRHRVSVRDSSLRGVSSPAPQAGPARRTAIVCGRAPAVMTAPCGLLLASAGAYGLGVAAYRFRRPSEEACDIFSACAHRLQPPKLFVIFRRPGLTIHRDHPVPGTALYSLWLPASHGIQPPRSPASSGPA